MNQSGKAPRIEVQDIDHLGIVAGIVDESALVEEIDRGVGVHRQEQLPKVGILCSFSLEEVQEIIASSNPVFREMASPTWRFVELPTGHYPMFSRPDDLAEVLLDLPPSGTSTQDGERSA